MALKSTWRKRVVLALALWTGLSAVPETDWNLHAGVLKIDMIEVTNIRGNSVLIKWRTNSPGSSEVEFGVEYALRSAYAANRELTKSHQITLTDLAVNTTYRFRVKSEGEKGNLAVSRLEFFRTSPHRGSIAPKITQVRIDAVTEHSVTVSWATDQSANSRMILGTDLAQLDLNVSQEAPTRNHSLTFRGLSAGKDYYFKVFSTSATGLISNSVTGSFTTLADNNGSDNVPPVPIIQIADKALLHNKIQVVSGETVHFSGSNSYDVDGDSLYFTWQFGDGTFSHEPDPTHTYATSGLFEVTLTVDDKKWPTYPANPFVIPMQQPKLTERGGIIVADFDGDGLLDYAVSTKDDLETSEETRATIGVYGHHGAVLWLRDVDLRINKGFYGLPGRFAPGISAADIDGDYEIELLHLDTRNGLVVRNGNTGEIEQIFSLPPAPDSAAFWGHFQIVNLRGRGDRDVILQADVVPDPEKTRNKFPWLAALSLESGEVLWTTNEYDGVRHGGFRAADLDFDGLDEVAGAVIIDHDGSRMNEWNYRAVRNPGHFDAIHFADVNPDIAGLEVIMLEEGKRDDDRVAIFNADSVIVYASRNGEEPQNVAIGDFDLNRPGLEIWCRSRFDFDQQPWVLDAGGSVIVEWAVNDHKPGGWTLEGIESIYRIDWDGGPRNFLAVKERHREGDIAIVDAMTGEFLRTWRDQAARLYVVDVAGDYREELVVVNNQSKEIRIYWNEAENTNVKPRYWQLNSYRREKLNYNYYSP